MTDKTNHDGREWEEELNEWKFDEKNEKNFSREKMRKVRIWVNFDLFDCALYYR